MSRVGRSAHVPHRLLFQHCPTGPADSLGVATLTWFGPSRYCLIVGRLSFSAYIILPVAFLLSKLVRTIWETFYDRHITTTALPTPSLENVVATQCHIPLNCFWVWIRTWKDEAHGWLDWCCEQGIWHFGLNFSVCTDTDIQLATSTTNTE